VTPSPLDDTIRRACGLEVAGWPLVIARRDTPGDGFERADDLHRPGRLLDQRIAASAALGKTHHRHVGAQWWFERCAFLVAATAFACVLTSRRIPSLSPANVLIAGADGIPAALGLRNVPLACGETAADDHLATVARTEIERHLEPLAHAITALRLRPAKALWRSAGDRTVQAALWIGTATRRHDDAVALAEAVLTPAGRVHVPLRLTAAAADPACDHLRSSCCLAHRAAGNVICDGCPRTHRLDRARRLPA
jgi:Ferric iron reductase FhuF-like transporter